MHPFHHKTLQMLNIRCLTLTNHFMEGRFFSLYQTVFKWWYKGVFVWFEVTLSSIGSVVLMMVSQSGLRCSPALSQ